MVKNYVKTYQNFPLFFNLVWLFTFRRSLLTLLCRFFNFRFSQNSNTFVDWGCIIFTTKLPIFMIFFYCVQKSHSQLLLLHEKLYLFFPSIHNGWSFIKKMDWINDISCIKGKNYVFLQKNIVAHFLFPVNMIFLVKKWEMIFPKIHDYVWLENVIWSTFRKHWDI